MTDVTFDCMGTDVRLLVDDPATCRAFLEHFDATLSRFRPDSELCRLNAVEITEVPASPLLRAAIAAGLTAARFTGGLVDPTLVPQWASTPASALAPSVGARRTARPRSSTCSA